MSQPIRNPICLGPRSANGVANPFACGAATCSQSVPFGKSSHWERWWGRRWGRRLGCLASLTLLTLLGPGNWLAQATSLQRWQVDPATQQLELWLAAGVTPEVSLLHAPPRIVIDFPGVTVASSQTQTYAGTIQQVRLGQFQPDRARMVIELAEGTPLSQETVRLQRVAHTVTAGDTPMDGERWLLSPVLAAATRADQLGQTAGPAAIALVREAFPVGNPPAAPDREAFPVGNRPPAIPSILASAGGPASPVDDLPPAQFLPPPGSQPITVRVPSLNQPAPSATGAASFQVPTVQTPTVQTPTVQTPTVQTPTVQTPTVTAPVATPAVVPPPAVTPPMATAPAATPPVAVPPAMPPMATPPVASAMPPVFVTPAQSASQSAPQPAPPSPAAFGVTTVPVLPASVLPAPSVSPAPMAPPPATVWQPSLSPPVPTPVSPPPPGNLIQFGQPLPTGKSPRSPVPAPSQQLAWQAPVSSDRLPVGTWLPLVYTGQAPLALQNGVAHPEVLVLQENLIDSRGNLFAPAGSRVLGRFEPGRDGSRFITQAIEVNGTSQFLAATSLWMQGDRNVPKQKLWRNSGIAAAAGMVLTGFTGIGLLAGAAAGLAGTYAVAPQPATIQPGQVIMVQVLEPIP